LPKGLRLLIMKEVKDLLRDPKILIGMILFPALLFPLMGAAINISTGSAIKSASGNLTLYIIDNDGGLVAKDLQSYAISNQINLIPTSGDPSQVVRNLEGGGTLIYVPAGFSQNITLNMRGDLILYTNFKDFSIAEFIKSQRASGLISTFEDAIIKQKVESGIPGTDPNSVLNPIYVQQESVIKGTAQPISPDLLQSVVRLQGLMGPIVIMLVLILAMQVAATSMAVEKEAKTLETLLTIPVSRLSILFGKLVGSVTIALLATIANVLAFTYYIGAITSQIPSSAGGTDLASLGLIPSAQGYLILGLTLFGALISALALALTLGTLAQDVRGAQSIIGIIMVPVFLPTIFLMMGDISTLPTAIQMVLYLIPFTYPVLASQALFTGNYGTLLLGLVYMAIFTFATLYIAARVFSTERVMTARLAFRRRRRTGAEGGQ
jgi:ABC-2 type transport system permease protein